MGHNTSKRSDASAGPERSEGSSAAIQIRDA